MFDRNVKEICVAMAVLKSSGTRPGLYDSGPDSKLGSESGEEKHGHSARTRDEA